MNNIGALVFFGKPESQFRGGVSSHEFIFNNPPSPQKNADTVDGQNPAPPRMMIILLFIGF